MNYREQNAAFERISAGLSDEDKVRLKLCIDKLAGDVSEVYDKLDGLRSKIGLSNALRYISPVCMESMSSAAYQFLVSLDTLVTGRTLGDRETIVHDLDLILEVKKPSALAGYVHNALREQSGAYRGNRNDGSIAVPKKISTGRVYNPRF